MNSLSTSTLDDIDDSDANFFADMEPPSEYGYNCSFRDGSAVVSPSSEVSRSTTSIESTTGSAITTSLSTRDMSIVKNRNKIMRLRQIAENTPSNRMQIIRSVSSQVDGGANAHIFTQLSDFFWFQSHRSQVTMANGSREWSEGYGCVLGKFEGSDKIIPFFPSYLLPRNEWATISPPSIRIYNGARRATVHSLHSFEIVDSDGDTIVVPTHHEERLRMHLDFVTVNIVKLHPSMSVANVSCPTDRPYNAAIVTRSQSKRLELSNAPRHADSSESVDGTTPTIESSDTPLCSDLTNTPSELSTAPPLLVPSDTEDDDLPPDETNDTLVRQQENRQRRRAQAFLIHQRMGHVPFTVLQEMARREMLHGLPKKLLVPDEPCLICLQAKGRTLPHGQTMSTDNLRAGQRVHMDYSFVNVVSYRGFTSFLSVVCAKTRKLFAIATRSKRPPLELCRFLYMMFSRMGCQPLEIRVDRGGELAKSSEFVNFWFSKGIVVNDTGGHASYLNGKVERPNQTIMAGVRALLINKNSPSSDWCEALSHYNMVYDMTLHRGIDDTPFHAWFGTKGSIENLRVWGATVHPIEPDRKKLDHRVSSGDFLGFNASTRLVRYRDSVTKNTKISSSAYFDEYNVRDSNGDLTPGSKQLLGQLQDLSSPPPTLALCDSPLMDRPIHNIQVVIPGGTSSLGLSLDFDKSAYLPVISAIAPTSPLYHQFPAHHRHDVFVLSIDGEEPISTSVLVEILQRFRRLRPNQSLSLSISKRLRSRLTPIEEQRLAFNQVQPFLEVPSNTPQLKAVLVSTPIPPRAPKNEKELNQSQWRSDYISARNHHFAKMNRTTSVSIPMLRSKVPPGRNILFSMLIYYNKKIPDLPHTYDFLCRWVSNGKNQVQGVDYEQSYSPVAKADSIRYCMAVAAEYGMSGYLLDVVNAFQSRFEHDPLKRQYLTCPPGYIDWFRREYPNVPIPSTNPRDLVVQTLTTFQGEKDASNKFYSLVKPVLEEDDFVVSQSDKGIFTKAAGDHRAMACLSTDDILLFTKDRKIYLSLREHLLRYFGITTKEGSLLRYLSLRIVISDLGISIDQTDYINKVLTGYFGTQDPKISKVDSSFPTDPSFEKTLANALPLTIDEQQVYEDRHNGSLAKWVGALMHATVWTRVDIGYPIMRLSGYMTAPTAPAYMALRHFMEWFWFHQHLPLMYPSKTSKKDKPIEVHFRRGSAEYTTLQSGSTPDVDPHVTNMNDADNARDLANRRSVNSILHLYNGTAQNWINRKQSVVMRHSTSSELRCFYCGVEYSVYLRQFASSIGYPIGSPILTYEDNQATIACVLANRVSNNLRHVDVMIRALHEWYIAKHFVPGYTNTNNQLADLNTKPHGSATYRRLAHRIVGVRFYPSPGAKHYELGAFALFTLE